jgi:hypothetical protein
LTRSATSPASRCSSARASEPASPQVEAGVEKARTPRSYPPVAAAGSACRHRSRRRSNRPRVGEASRRNPDTGRRTGTRRSAWSRTLGARRAGQVIVAFWTDAATDQSVSSDLPLEVRLGPCPVDARALRSTDRRSRTVYLSLDSMRLGVSDRERLRFASGSNHSHFSDHPSGQNGTLRHPSPPPFRSSATSDCPSRVRWARCSRVKQRAS